MSSGERSYFRARFQPLIGRLITGKVHFQVLQNIMFQPLIGRLITGTDFINTIDIWTGFQPLIGRLITLFISLRLSPFTLSFNPL